MENLLGRFSRFQLEESVNLKIKIMQSKEKMKKSEQSLREIWKTTKCTKVCIMGAQKEKRKTERAKTYLKK